MRILSRQLTRWLHLGLIVTLLLSLLPPAPLAMASMPEPQASLPLEPQSLRWPQLDTRSISSLKTHERASQSVIVPVQNKETLASDSVPRTLALPFDFGQATTSSSELSRAKAAGIVSSNSPVPMTSDFSQLPLSFVPNAGQLDLSVQFQAHGMLGSNLFFAPNEVILALPRNAADPASTNEPPAQLPTTLRLRFEGATPSPQISGGERLPGVVSYFIGNDPTQWQTNLPTYGEIVYRNLYPGIDLHYNGTEGALKGTYVVAPGADPSQIRWRYEGAESVSLDKTTGNLLITLKSHSQSPITEHAPVTWQEVDGQRITVRSHYTITGQGVISLVLGNYDPGLPLIIDPTLDFSTYLGNTGDDEGASIAVDSAGNIYVTGRTTSSNFPYVSGSYPKTGDNSNVFVTKISPTGSYVFSTYLGGNQEDSGSGIAVDNQGNIYVTGSTLSWSNFPTTTGALKSLSSEDCLVFASQQSIPSQTNSMAFVSPKNIVKFRAPIGRVRSFPSHEGFNSEPAIKPEMQYNSTMCEDAFLIQLNPSGSALLYGTYLGGSKHDKGRDIALDNQKNIYITGETWPDASNPDSPLTTLGFPTVNAVQPTWGGDADAFVTKIISASGVYTYGYSTYLGGESSDYGYGIAVDNSGNAYVTGQTSSTAFSTTNELQAYQGSVDAFVTKIISASGVYTYGYSTYLGGESDDYGRGIAVDSNGNAYITGYTLSSQYFPTKNEIQGYQESFDTFVTKIISASGVYTYGYSTYLGGESYDYGYSIAVDNAGDAYITGGTYSSNFPTTLNALTYTHRQEDVFVTKIISASGVYTYGYSTYLGGTSYDTGQDIAITNDGLQVYVTGETQHDFPITPSATQLNPGDSTISFSHQDAFISRIVWPSDLTLNFNGSETTARVGQPIQYQVTVGNDSETTAANLVLTQTLPAVISYTAASISPTSVLPPTDAGQRLVWNLSSLAGSSLTTLIITGTVLLSAPVGSTLRTTATVTSNLAETNLANNTLSFTSTVQPGSVHHLALVVPQTVGLLAPFSATVTARDVAGNVATGYTGTITLTGTGQLKWNNYSEEIAPIQQAIAAPDQGETTFYRLKFKPVGQQIITATNGTLVVTASMTVDDSLVIIDDYTIWDESEVSVGDLIINNGRTLYLKGSTLITADNITIQSYGAISADEARDQSGSGPGAGDDGVYTPFYNVSDSAGGGGYGGPGQGPSNRGGETYGSEGYPTDQGSNGGDGFPYDTPGKGGGAIHLVVSDTLVLTGGITAEGGYGYGYGAGAGSGGSILIEASKFSGNGWISVNGGWGELGNSGGGGRIAIYADAYNFTGSLQADGGSGHEVAGRSTPYLSFVDLNRSSMVISPTTLAANGLATALATVTLKTSTDAPVPDRPVKLVVSPLSGTFINGQPATTEGVTLAPTNANGVTTAQITSTVSGVKQVAAQTINGVTISQTVTITFNHGALDPSRSLVEFVDDGTAAADGVDSVAVRVTARDAFDNPIAGLPVVLTSTAPVSFTQPPATDASGQTTGTITSTWAGVAPIQAVINGISASQTITATFGGADIAIRKTGPAQAVPGQPILYNLTVENNGLIPATGVIVTDTLPSAISYTTHSASITPTVSGSQIVWDFGTLATQSSQSFALIGQVTETVAAGQQLSNTVRVTSLTSDNNSSNNTQTVTATVIAPYSHTLTLDPNPLTARLGATETVRLQINNTGPLADVYTVTVTGLNPAWYTPITDNFPLNPGGSATTDLQLRVADCAISGTVPFTVGAYSQEGGLVAQAPGELNLFTAPQQLDLVPADGSKIGSRSVLFSWRTDAPTTGTLTLQPSGSTTQTITQTTALSTVHTVIVENLSRNTNYTWQVQSVSACGQVSSSPRTFTVSNGIVFTEHDISTYRQHDYNQTIALTVKNEDLSRSHTLRVLLDNPYDDLIANFVGEGSIDDAQNYIVLEPGQSRNVTLAIHAQDAEQKFYHLTAKVIANEGTNDEIVDYAHLEVEILKADQFELALRGTDPDTLVKTYVITNTGLPITDLNIQAIDPQTGLPARALIQPTLNHARLGIAESLEFKVIPLFSPDDAIGLQAFARMGRSEGLASPLAQQGNGIEVQVVASAGGNNQQVTQAHQCEIGDQLYAITQRNVRLQYYSADWYCTNRPNVNLNLSTPGAINPADVLGATLANSFRPMSGEVKPHSMQLYFNPTLVGSFNNTIPFGDYLFDVNPADLRPAASPVSVVNQTIGIRTQHSNGGHYQVTSGARLDLVLDHYTCYVCAADANEARALGCQGVLPNPTNLQIQITEPVSGTNLSLNQPVDLTAQVDDALTQQIPYPVEALITYRDIISGGAPVQEQIVLPYQVAPVGTQWDTYQATWTPTYTGDVSITAIVDAVTISNSTTIDVSINPEPADLVIKILNPPDKPNAGDVIQIQAEVTNLGGDINQYVPIRFEYYFLEFEVHDVGNGYTTISTAWVLEGLPYEATPLLQLASGEKTTVMAQPFTIPRSGNYKVVAKADP